MLLGRLLAAEANVAEDVVVGDVEGYRSFPKVLGTREWLLVNCSDLHQLGLIISRELKFRCVKWFLQVRLELSRNGETCCMLKIRAMELCKQKPLIVIVVKLEKQALAK